MHKPYLRPHQIALPLLFFVLTLSGCNGSEENEKADSSSSEVPDTELRESWDSRVEPPSDEDSQIMGGEPGEEPQSLGTDSETPGGDTTWWEPCPEDVLEARLMNVGEVTLNVTCRGSGPTIVFLHGFPEFHYGWHQVMDELATEYRLVAPDQRGYNLSDKPNVVEAYELPRLTEDIVNLLPLVSEAPVILVAHDWGGPVGWMVAHTPGAHLRGFVSTNGPHPTRFADLIANDPAQQEASSYMDVFKNDSAETFMTTNTLSAMLADVIDEETMGLYIDAWNQPGAVTGGLNWYRANSLAPDDVSKVMAPLSPTIPVPVTVMWGEDDEFVLSSNADKLDSFASELEVFLYPGVDHWIAHRIPEEVAIILRAMDLKTREN